MRTQVFHNNFIICECASTKTNQSTTKKENEDDEDYNLLQNLKKHYFKMNAFKMIRKLKKIIVFLILMLN